MHAGIPYTLLDVRCWVTTHANVTEFFLPVLRKIIEVCIEP